MIWGLIASEEVLIGYLVFVLLGAASQLLFARDLRRGDAARAILVRSLAWPLFSIRYIWTLSRS